MIVILKESRPESFESFRRFSNTMISFPAGMTNLVLNYKNNRIRIFVILKESRPESFYAML